MSRFRLQTKTVGQNLVEDQLVEHVGRGTELDLSRQEIIVSDGKLLDQPLIAWIALVISLGAFIVSFVTYRRGASRIRLAIKIIKDPEAIPSDRDAVVVRLLNTGLSPIEILCLSVRAFGMNFPITPDFKISGASIPVKS
jgi:hypothetical protein